MHLRSLAACDGWHGRAGSGRGRWLDEEPRLPRPCVRRPGRLLAAGARDAARDGVRWVPPAYGLLPRLFTRPDLTPHRPREKQQVHGKSSDAEQQPPPDGHGRGRLAPL